MKRYLFDSLKGFVAGDNGNWIKYADHLVSEIELQKQIKQLQEEKVELENLAEEIQKNQAKRAKYAVEWDALSDDYLEQLVKEIKVSAFNGTAAVVFLVIIILQNLGVIPCMK